MKITKSRLKQIIKEELADALTEQERGSDASINKTMVVNQARDRLRKKIQTLPGLGGRADLPFQLQEAIASELFRLSGGDSKKCLSMADTVGDMIVDLSKPEIKDGKLDKRILMIFAKKALDYLKGMPASKVSKKKRPRHMQVQPGPAANDNVRRTTSVVQGTLRNVRIKMRKEGNYYIATATNEDGVSAEGAARFRGSINLARSAAAADARANLLKKLQGTK